MVTYNVEYKVGKGKKVHFVQLERNDLGEMFVDIIKAHRGEDVSFLHVSEWNDVEGRWNLVVSNRLTNSQMRRMSDGKD